MTKEVSECRLCGVKRMLNYANLCKRCAHTQKGAKIALKAFEKHQEELAFEAEHEAEEETQQAEEQTEETTTEDENKEATEDSDQDEQKASS